ncbi:hypothetical protein [Myroides odoratimimus]|uniref:hypothetical protein n=1 Tax=Myroides odoratimimus TaxID=76832 RepID=UPI003100C2F7
MKKMLLLMGILVGTNIGLSYGQVVLGGGTMPIEGALVDVKSKSADADNITGSKGFMLPRVMLTDIKKLTPMVKTETPENRKEHIGLQVYHVGGGTSTISSGLKIWNGEKWDGLNAAPTRQWIYMPPFPIKMYDATEQKISLYDEYVKQIGNNGHIGGGVDLWGADEVEFEIIGFDKTAFSALRIESPDANGKHYLIYKANVGKLTAASYLNIIIVKK